MRAASSEDQQQTFLLWAVAVLFSQQDYRSARESIASGSIQINGKVVHDLVRVVHSGDLLVSGANPRTVDLDTLKKANVLRRQIEMFMGGAELAYARINAEIRPTNPTE